VNPCRKCGVRPKMKGPGNRYCRECSVAKPTGLALQASRHGLTLDQYNDLLESQGGRCAICGEVPTRSFAIDHDHSCCPGAHSCGQCVRGLLCSNCNVTLGLMKDDPARLRSAATYLENI
jgi:hypothetical protein